VLHDKRHIAALLGHSQALSLADEHFDISLRPRVSANQLQGNVDSAHLYVTGGGMCHCCLLFIMHRVGRKSRCFMCAVSVVCDRFSAVTYMFIKTTNAPTTTRASSSSPSTAARSSGTGTEDPLLVTVSTRHVVTCQTCFLFHFTVGECFLLHSVAAQVFY